MDTASFDTVRSLMEQPSRTTSQDAEVLEQCILEYPYFHAAFLLLAHALRQGPAGTWSRQLPRLSVHVRNRSLLPRIPDRPCPDPEPAPLTVLSVETVQKAAIPAPETEVVVPEAVAPAPDIIDQFLEHPRIAPPEKDSDFKVNISDSLREDEDLATETLARIYLDRDTSGKP
jgi:hypothetical protein